MTGNPLLANEPYVETGKTTSMRPKKSRCVIKETADGFYLCDFVGCTYKTKKKETMKAHRSHTHISKKSFKCPHCDKAPYRLRDSLAKHVRRHHSNETKQSSPKFIKNSPLADPSAVSPMITDTAEEGSSESLEDIIDYFEDKKNCVPRNLDDLSVSYFDINELIDLPENFDNTFSAILNQNIFLCN